jgi:LysR family transcriptional regulator, glycine cleavage system transcriptional activator
LKVRRFNSFVIAVQAALDGQGVVLGWQSLVETLIDSKRLKHVGRHVMPAPQSFYLTWSIKRALSPEASTLKEWLLKSLG